ncbi:MAG: hypothetical protein VW839_11715, partial [Sphingopyxis sp.]
MQSLGEAARAVLLTPGPHDKRRAARAFARAGGRGGPSHRARRGGVRAARAVRDRVLAPRAVPDEDDVFVAAARVRSDAAYHVVELLAISAQGRDAEAQVGAAEHGLAQAERAAARVGVRVGGVRGEETLL